MLGNGRLLILFLGRPGGGGCLNHKNPPFLPAVATAITATTVVTAATTITTTTIIATTTGALFARAGFVDLQFTLVNEFTV